MDLKKIEPSIEIGQNVKVFANDLKIGYNVRIGNNVTIQTDRLRLGNQVTIGQEVNIEVESLEIGFSSRIEDRCHLSGMGSAARFIQIGEHSFLGHDSKLMVPIAIIGDYTSIHNHCLLNGRQPLIIGHNGWIGQHCVLNAEDKLTIGNNVGIGAYSSLYTHGYFGDLLYGSQIFNIAPIEIEDDVWILGSYNVISPGVSIGEKALILTGSLVTKDVPSNHTIAGSPARDITNQIVPYREVSSDEKALLISKFVKEFVEIHHSGHYEQVEDGFIVNAQYGRFDILFVKQIDNSENIPKNRPLLIFTLMNNLSNHIEGVTFFNLITRQYTRTRSKPEVDIIKFLKSYRARFVPEDQPRLCLPSQYLLKL